MPKTPTRKAAGLKKSGSAKKTTAAQHKASHAPNGEIDYGPLAQRIGYHLRRAQVAVFADFYACFDPVTIRPVQYSILTIIEHNPGLLQTQVAMALGIKKANFVGLISDLEQRGLVTRIQQETDRRSYGLYLSAQGQDFMPQLHDLALHHEQRVVRGLSKSTCQDLFASLQVIARRHPASASS